MASAEQCNPLCRNMISYCWIRMFSVYFHTRIKNCCYTKPLLYETAVIRNCCCTKLLLYKIAVVPNRYYTKLLLYQTAVIPNCCYTKLLLYQTAVIPNSIPLPCCEKLNANWKPRVFEIRSGRGIAGVDIPRMKCIVFWNMTRCSFVAHYNLFGGIYWSSGWNDLLSHPRRQYRRSSTYAVVALRKVQRKLYFSQVGTE